MNLKNAEIEDKNGGRMNVCTLVCVVIAMLGTGCQATKPVTTRSHYDALIQSRQALSQGQKALAAQRLAEARSLATAQGPGASMVEVDALEVEFKLREGNVSEALIQAGNMLSRNPNHAQAHEVLGKALLLDGDFQGAEKALLKASDDYTKPADLQRIADLIALVRGLSAYSNGDPAVAHTHWKRIKEPELRASVDNAVRDATQRPLARN